jgi:hypothetical protein
MIKILVEIFGFFTQFVKIYIVGGDANKGGDLLGTSCWSQIKR